MESLIYDLNLQAKAYLQLQDHPNALSHLKLADEELKNIQDSPQKFALLSLTLKNYGVYYTQLEKFSTARSWLKRALHIEQQRKNPIEISEIWLNLCTVYRNLVEHTKALKYAIKALDFLLIANDDKVVPSMVKAHYNIGVQNEHLGRYTTAQSWYSRGYKLATKKLGRADPLTQQLADALSKTNGSFATFKIRRFKLQPISSNKSTSRNTTPELKMIKSSRANSLTPNPPKTRRRIKFGARKIYQSIDTDIGKTIFNIKKSLKEYRQCQRKFDKFSPKSDVSVSSRKRVLLVRPNFKNLI